MYNALISRAGADPSIRAPTIAAGFTAWESTAATTGEAVATMATILATGITPAFTAGRTVRGASQSDGVLESVDGAGPDRHGMATTADSSRRIQCIHRPHSGSLII